MKKQALARNLAQSVTLSDWSEATVEAALRRRLPASLQKSPRALAVGLVRDLPSRYAPSPQRVARHMVQLGPFTTIWRSCKRRDVWPAPDHFQPLMTPIDAFARLDLPGITTANALADWLFLPPERLDYLCDMQSRAERHDDMAVNHYHYHIHPKASGGQRLVEAPKQGLKAVQRQILHRMLDLLPPHPNAYGFIPGRNAIDAAQRHAGEAVVLRFDLKDFFPSINAGRVFGLFRCLGYPHEVSRRLTALSTTATPPRVLARLDPDDRTIFRTPHLPQGAPTSPALANQMCHGLDCRLAGLATRIDATYTRYADDLTFSGDARVAAILVKAVPQIVGDEGFRLNPAKTRVMRHGARKTVTGMVVNAHVNVDRPHFDHLKAVIHALGKPEDTRLADPSFRASLLGQIGWVEQVNPTRGAKLRRLLEKSWSRQ